MEAIFAFVLDDMLEMQAGIHFLHCVFVHNVELNPWMIQLWSSYTLMMGIWALNNLLIVLGYFFSQVGMILQHHIFNVFKKQELDVQ